MASIHAALSPLGVAARWAARGLSAALVGLVLVIFIGEGGVDPRSLSPAEGLLTGLLFTSCAGMLAGVRWERVGGAVSLAAALAFLSVEFIASGNPASGLVFYLMLLPGALYLAAGALAAPRVPG